MKIINSINQTKLAGYTFLFLCMFWGLLFIYSIHSILPYNAVKLPFERFIKTQNFFPQGWKFFTRSPREDIVDTYAKDVDNRWVTIIQSNASPSNLFGMKRTSRAKSVESSLLLGSASENNINWIKCDESPQSCADKIPSNGTIINNSPKPYICGEVVFLSQPPVPWSWSRSKRPVIMPSKIIKTNILCQ